MEEGKVGNGTEAEENRRRFKLKGGRDDKKKEEVEGRKEIYRIKCMQEMK